MYVDHSSGLFCLAQLPFEQSNDGIVTFEM
jgi:hypothetical protein